MTTGSYSIEKCDGCDIYKRVFYRDGLGNVLCQECYSDLVKLGRLHEWSRSTGDRRPVKSTTTPVTKWGKGERGDDTVVCSLCKGYDIYLDYDVKVKILVLMEEYKYKEWIGYFVGEIDESDIFVWDLIVPPHAEASHASAEAEPFHMPEECVGIIHSHNSMGAFHSGTDIEYVDSNYPVSVTVSNRKDELEYDAIAMKTTECGKLVRMKCKVIYSEPSPSFPVKEWLEEAKTNIEKESKKTAVVSSPNPTPCSQQNIQGLGTVPTTPCKTETPILGTMVNVGGIVMKYSDAIALGFLTPKEVAAELDDPEWDDQKTHLQDVWTEEDEEWRKRWAGV